MPPIAIAAIGIASAIGGTVAGAVGHKQAGDAAAAAADYNANADIERASIQEQQQRQQDRVVMGRSKALIGSSGVQITGSPLDVLAESARQAELNALIIRRGGQLNAQSERMAGAAAQTSQDIQAGTTLLTGGASAAQQINAARQNFGTPSSQATSTPLS